jgi:hypothetical protein
MPNALDSTDQGDPLSPTAVGGMAEGFQRESAPIRQQQERASRAPLPRQPRLERTEAPPSANIGNDAMMWLAAATAIGGIAGAMTRRHTTNALAAFTGTLEGLKEGNQQKFDNNFKTWKASAEQVKQNNDAELEEYRQAIENRNLEDRQRSIQLQIIANKWHNQFAAAAFKHYEQTGDMSMATAVFDALTSQNDKGFEALSRISEARERYGVQQKQKMDEAKDIADAIRKRQQPPTMTGMYGIAPLVRQELAKTGTDIGRMQLDWQRLQTLARSSNTQQRLTYLSASAAFDRTTDRIKYLAEDLKLNSVPAVNYGQLLALSQARTGPASEAATRYITQITTAQEQFASLVRGGYTPTNEAFALAFKQINPNMSLRNLEAGLEELRLDVQYRTNALDALSGGLGPQSPNQYIPGAGGNNARSLSDDDLMRQLGP